MRLKAYIIQDSEGCGPAVLVATYSAGRARSLGSKSEWMGDLDFIDLSVRRLPAADDWAQSQKVETFCDGGGKGDSELMRSLGWYQHEGSGESCGECDLYEWEGLPESILFDAGDGYICRGCREAQKKEALDNLRFLV